MNDEKRKALAALATLIAASSATIDDLDVQAAEIARKRAVEVEAFNRHSEELAMLLKKQTKNHPKTASSSHEAVSRLQVFFCAKIIIVEIF